MHHSVQNEIGFDTHYAFNVEICEAFNKRMCGIKYTRVDHVTAMEPLSASPLFDQEVEYETLKFEESEYKEIEVERPPG